MKIYKWSINDRIHSRIVHDNAGNVIVECFGDESSTNAQRIVECVNGWDGLNKEKLELETSLGGFKYSHDADQKKIKELTEQNKKLEFMVENGLGYKDMENDNV